MNSWNIATGNPDKLDEFRRMLEAAFGAGVVLRSLRDFPELPEPVEDGDTLEANALIKARALFEHTGAWCVADDTGLIVPALGGEPGVYSARWAGPDCSYADNVAKMCREIRSVPLSERQASFETVIAIVGPGLEHCVRGVCAGLILDAPRGAGGFGYDPVFLVPEQKRTFAEMDAVTKNKTSHRGQALRAMLEYLKGNNPGDSPPTVLPV